MAARRPRKWRTRQWQDLLRKNAEAAVAEAAVRIQAEAKRLLSKRGPGPPSPPGQPPALQTGQLRQSVQVDLSGLSRRNPIARVGPGVPYAAVHEFGGTRHPKRPYMKPAADKVQSKLGDVIRTRLLKGMRTK